MDFSKRMFGAAFDLSILFSEYYVFQVLELFGMPVQPLDKGSSFAAAFQKQMLLLIIHNSKNTAK